MYVNFSFLSIETVEESSFLKSEIDRLSIENERLRAEITSSHSQSSHSPQVCVLIEKEYSFSLSIFVPTSRKQ